VRSERRRDLLWILRQGSAHSQQDIVERLTAAGHHITQATVSRDLREVGAVKVRQNGGFVYRLADEAPRSAASDLVVRNLLRTLGEFALEVREAASLVVIATAPGHAAAVARAVDIAAVDEVVGTVAGDDTIFVATRDAHAAAELARRWRSGEPADSKRAER
jgi:transcriptional regulator of arginine metabolism